MAESTGRSWKRKAIVVLGGLGLGALLGWITGVLLDQPPGSSALFGGVIVFAAFMVFDEAVGRYEQAKLATGCLGLAARSSAGWAAIAGGAVLGLLVGLNADPPDSGGMLAFTAALFAVLAGVFAGFCLMLRAYGYWVGPAIATALMLIIGFATLGQRETWLDVLADFAVRPVFGIVIGGVIELAWHRSLEDQDGD